MQSATTGASAKAMLRPTQLVAEALVNRHNTEELVSRAKKLGFSRDLTKTVVAVCCCDRNGRSSSPGDRS